MSLKSQKKHSLILLLVLLNLFLITSECWSLSEEEIGPNDWYRIWSNPESVMVNCYDMILDSDNNIYLTGAVYSSNLQSYEMVLIKYQNTSDYSISRSWNTDGSDISYAMAIDSSNNIYLAGISDNYSNKFYTLVKFDNDLNYQWNITWGPYEDNRCYSVAIDSQDNIYLGGRIMQENGDFDICLVKYNITGDFQWNQIWSHFTDDYCNAITIDSSDNIYLTGRTMRTGIDSRDDLCLLKYNSSGYLQWSRVRDAPSYEIGLGIALDSKEDIFIVGQTDSDLSIYSIDTFLVKYTKDGMFEWNRIFSGDMYCYSTDIVLDSTDNIYLGGLTKLSESNGPSASVLKYDNNGTLQWHIEWGEPHIEECRAIAIDSMNNILIAGDISSYEYQIDGIFIVRNPKSLASPMIINGFSIFLIISCTLIGMVLSLHKLFKKKIVIT